VVTPVCIPVFKWEQQSILGNNCILQAESYASSDDKDDKDLKALL